MFQNKVSEEFRREAISKGKKRVSDTILLCKGRQVPPCAQTSHPLRVHDRPCAGPDVSNDFKVIVVSGARSHVGKTCLARALRKLLPGAVRIKIGHHPRKPLRDDGYFYPMGTSFTALAAEHGNAPFLIIESNRILEEITPECVIYLSAENPKPSAELAVKKADIIRGVPVPASKVSILAERLGCNEALIRKIVALSDEFKGEG